MLAVRSNQTLRLMTSEGLIETDPGAIADDWPAEGWTRLPAGEGSSERCADLLGDNGWRWRVLRTSNAYLFTDPSPAADRPNSSKSEKLTSGRQNPLDLTKLVFDQFANATTPSTRT